ncbi:hypothetical protein [Variovorax sp. LT1R16]|uniref:hypothetical protein n=1 Tax=Variovorax sp. LT1R16 TaxID=3443728 RepID=UPI003F4809FC
MGYGPFTNGKQTPITPWKGSWAEQEQARREGTPSPTLVHTLKPGLGWPVGRAIRGEIR